MAETELYAIIALSVIIIILLVVLLVRKPQVSGGISEKLAVTDEKIKALTENVDAEFERSRRETLALQQAQRKETAESLRAMNDKLEQMNVRNTDYQNRLIISVGENLEKISRSNAEQAEKMRQSNEQKLEQMRLTVDEKLTSTLSSRLDSSFKAVSDRLENVNKSIGEMKELSTSVTANVNSLNRVLSNVKARGTWAEVQLGAILDQTIPGMYETNFSTDGSNDRVEFAVKIPSSDGSVVYLPVDSKFPMEDYIRVCSAADSADAQALEAARKALENSVFTQAKKVAKYINVPRTTPYAILYLATDALFAEIVASERGVVERIQSECNVMVAGPTTITALLNSLSMGFRAVAINEKANEVRELLAVARDQYDRFGIVLTKARKKIEEAGQSIDEAQHRNEIINKKLKSAGSAGSDTTENENINNILEDVQ
ncbi:MAG: DNA recombination protein RmuC [Clostridia bacterium]|nr:DNA recombination protein RmuC [Clostridia bacterium]